MLEESNVSAVESVVQLINVQRNAEMMQRALSIFDSQFNQTAVTICLAFSRGNPVWRREGRIAQEKLRRKNL